MLCMSVLSIVFVSKRESHRMGYCTAKAFAGPQRQGELICNKGGKWPHKTPSISIQIQGFFFEVQIVFLKVFFLALTWSLTSFSFMTREVLVPPILLLPHIIIYLIPLPPWIVRIDHWTVVRKVLANGRGKKFNLSNRWTIAYFIVFGSLPFLKKASTSLPRGPQVLPAGSH